MTLSIPKRLLGSKSVMALGAQVCLLLTNFCVFIVLIREYNTTDFGEWALYITVLLIIDSFRQGIVQNGLIRLLVQNPAERSQINASATLINYGFIAVITLIIWVLSPWVEKAGLALLTQHGYKGLLALGTLHFINSLSIGRAQFTDYLVQAIIYLLTSLSGLALLWYGSELSFVNVINLQLLAVIPSMLYHLLRARPRLSLPSRSHTRELLGFAKYVAGTNLLSMLFHKSDVLMLSFFTDPTTVAIFHFATKIVGYSEIPFNAMSQVIYPELAASYRSSGVSGLKQAYIRAVIRLFTLGIPVIVGVMIFRDQIIYTLSTDSYQQASQVIMILCLGVIIKPIGRVFGLTLDAMGMPKINFQMLAFSFVVNLTMNWVLIPLWGLNGAAIATSLSIVLTIAIGQIRLRKWLPIHWADLKTGWQESVPNTLIDKMKLI